MTITIRKIRFFINPETNKRTAEFDYDDPPRKDCRFKRQFGDSFHNLKEKPANDFLKILNATFLGQEFEAVPECKHRLDLALLKFIEGKDGVADYKFKRGMGKSEGRVVFSRIGITSPRAEGMHATVFFRMTLAGVHKHASISFKTREIAEGEKDDAREFFKNGFACESPKNFEAARAAAKEWVDVYEDGNDIELPDKRKPFAKKIDFEDKSRKVGNLFIAGPRYTDSQEPSVVFAISVNGGWSNRLNQVCRKLGVTKDEIMTSNEKAAKAKVMAEKIFTDIESKLLDLQRGASDFAPEIVMVGRYEKFKDKKIEDELKQCLSGIPRYAPNAPAKSR